MDVGPSARVLAPHLKPPKEADSLSCRRLALLQRRRLLLWLTHVLNLPLELNSHLDSCLLRIVFAIVETVMEG